MTETRTVQKPSKTLLLLALLIGIIGIVLSLGGGSGFSLVLILAAVVLAIAGLVMKDHRK